MPRRQILSSEEQERLLVIPDDEIILTRMCFLNELDIALINKHRRPANRLGFAVLLCYLRGPGFIPDKSSAPHNGVVSRVASRLKLQPDLWPEYASREQTRWEHLTELYRYLELSPFSRSMQKDCIRHLHPYAMRTDKGFMLAEEMLSWLHNNNVIFPSVEVIERTLAEVVTLANRSVFSTLTAQLEKQHKSALDSLLISEGEQPSRLAWLLQPPGKINGKNVLQHIDRLNSIAALGLPDGIALSVHQNRLLKLAREGRKMSSRDLAKFTEVISDKGVKITPLENSVPSGVSPFADLVYGMLPHPKITEILEEVDSWTGFTRHFAHLKNNNVRPKDGRLLLTTILADGINLGLTKMAESCPGATRSSLEGIQAWYIRDETYSAALAELVNAQKERPLAAFWGDGTTSSSDGQNFRVGSHGRYAGQVNLKYGQEPGVQIYTHISDQYSPFYAKVISRVRDSTHVLDGLLYHESDLEITEHYTDTAGFTEHVFALMHLLGFAFAPRIRDLHDKRLFIHGKAERYPGLQSVISTTCLNIKDIESHWDEVLRLATSIKQGTVTASLMMKKLASYPKQNGLAKALREIGRIERTLFMLDWFRDPGLRRRVQAGLNKGEARNALARAVFLHRLGEIRDRGLENQSYRASGLTLLTAAITLWNTVYIERAIESLKRKGIPINEQLVSHLSPLGWEHINLSGDYVWRNNLKLGSGKYRSLRTVDTALYKKQS